MSSSTDRGRLMAEGILNVSEEKVDCVSSGDSNRSMHIKRKKQLKSWLEIEWLSCRSIHFVGDEMNEKMKRYINESIIKPVSSHSHVISDCWSQQYPEATLEEFAPPSKSQHLPWASYLNTTWSNLQHSFFPWSPPWGIKLSLQPNEWECSLH